MRLVGMGLGLIGIVGSLKSPVPASIASASQTEILNTKLSGTIAQAGSTGLEKVKDVDYWVNRCNLLASAQKYQEALAACEQAISLRPKSGIIWAAHSGILLNLKQYPEAIASADNALKFDENNSLALTYRCMAFSALKQNETALDTC